MILTVTLNPAIDISYILDKLNIDGVNRVSKVSKTAGGKGLNVSRVLALSGESVLATGFYGGPLSRQINQELSKLDIEDKFVSISGETRNNIAILHEGKQTEILEAGPSILQNEAEQFLKNLSEIIQNTSKYFKYFKIFRNSSYTLNTSKCFKYFKILQILQNTSNT
jgi:tagatose 6-phosphate kinase